MLGNLVSRIAIMSDRCLSLAALFSPDYRSQTAVVAPQTGLRCSYAELEAEINELAQQIKRAGIGPGDFVAMVLPNSLEFVITFLAVTFARATAAPMNPALTAEELRSGIERLNARVLIVSPGCDAQRQVARVLDIPVWEVRLNTSGKIQLDGAFNVPGHKSRDDGPESTDVALFLYTSGTTSRPKGVPLSHGNLLASAHSFASCFGLSPCDATLVVMPLFHVHGLLGATLSTFYSGGTVVLPQRFSASNFWSDVTTYGVTWYTAAPTIHQILLKRADADGAPRKGLRFIRSSSAKLPLTTLTGLEQRFSTVVVEAYGMTEAANQISSNPLPPGTREVGTVGRAMGMEIAILDALGNPVPNGLEGEVCIRGPSVMHGYYQDSEANQGAFINGWFRTGDQGFLDEHGYLNLHGRIKDLINRGGEKISPSEIDAVLLEHPAVMEAVCFGLPDEKYGEEVYAAVVLKSETDSNEIMAFCQERLAQFKAPKRIHVVDRLPRTATNKVQRHLVSQLLSQ